MRGIAEPLAEQALGRRRIAQRRQEEVDGRPVEIDGPIEVTPAPCTRILGLIARQDLLVGLSCRRNRCFTSGP